MEKLSDGPLARALERERERFNARFAYAKRVNRGLDPADFAEHLRLVAAPIVDAVAALKPERVDEVVAALYEVSLDLLGHDCLGSGSRYPEVTEVWQKLLPRLPAFLAADPERLAASISNAVYNLAAQPQANAELWIQSMERLAPSCADVDQLLDLGKVLAWRAGMAHYRESALEVWAGLPTELMHEAVGVKQTADASRYQLIAAMADPWHWTGVTRGLKRRQLEIVASVGGFRGFGGPFVNPPQATAKDGQLYLYDRQSCWALHADCFGATLQRFGPNKPDGARATNKEFSINAQGEVSKGKTTAQFPVLKNYSSAATEDGTFAVTLPRSHKVFLVALV